MSNDNAGKINKEVFNKIVQSDKSFQWAQGANWYDDHFARLCLADPKTVQELINNTLPDTGLISEDNLVHVSHVEVQKTVKFVNRREIIFDVLCEDSNGRAFDVEIQFRSDKMSPQRARYYASGLDSQMLAPKQKYEDLKDSYVIVFFESDPRGKGEMYYVIERCYMDTKERFNDGSHIVYINGNITESSNKSSRLAKVIHALKQTNPDLIRLPEMAKRAKYLKSNKENLMYELENRYPAFLYDFAEDFKNEGKEEGRIEGKEEGRIEGKEEGRIEGKEEIASKLLKEGFKVKKVVRLTGLPKEKVAQLASSV